MSFSSHSTHVLNSTSLCSSINLFVSSGIVLFSVLRLFRILLRVVSLFSSSSLTTDGAGILLTSKSSIESDNDGFKIRIIFSTGC